MLADDDLQKVLTVSRKSERLVNLTIALLATKRYLTKSEIFRTLEGYEGSAQTKERMFERDKDDLRALGIEIEVGSFDPLFEDEPGYRIKPESYKIQLTNLSHIDVALLSIAASAWQGAALDTSALSALLKLSSMGIESDLDSLPALAPRISSGSLDLELLTEAISKRDEIKFSYRGSDLSLTERNVRPYGFASAYGDWYIVGHDVERKAIRTFKSSRIAGDISTVKLSSSFDIPNDFQIQDYLKRQNATKEAELKVRVGKAHALRIHSQLLNSDGDWDSILCSFEDEDLFVQSILWHGIDCVVIHPLELRDKIISTLKQTKASHD